MDWYIRTYFIVALLAMTSLSDWTMAEDSLPLVLTHYLDGGSATTARRVSRVNRNLAFDGVKLPKSHAGYLKVNNTADNHMFFWFFPSQAGPKQPLLLWLNGGPTISSMLGLLWENGPVQCVTGSGTEVKANPFSWTKFAAVLYVDNPAGVGYSYSGKTDGRTKQDEITLDLYNFLDQFFRIFPEYKKRDFYVGGQSYAGKYIPSLAHFIHNKKMSGQTDMPLTGVYLGGPLYDPPIQLLYAADYYYAAGAISHKTFTESKKGLRSIVKELAADGTTTMDFNTVIGKFLTGIPFSDNYATRLQAGFDCVQSLMDSAKVRSAVHSGSETTYAVGNEDFQQKFGPEFMVSTKSKLAVLMDNYKVLIYNGDLDSIVSSNSVEESLMTTPWSGQTEYKTQTRSDWMKDKNQLGYFSNTGRFCRVIVMGAGHQVPHDQPERTTLMMKSFIKTGCVS